MNSCLTREKTNKGRQMEFDIAKGLAIIFMVMCHTYEYLSDYSNDVMFIVLDLILGSPFAAPVFMFCMGIGVYYSRKNQPADLLVRGVRLFGVSLLFGLLRDVILVVITWLISGEREVLSYVELFFCVDILRFAALAFMFFAFLKRIRVSDTALALMAVVFSCLGYALQGVSTGIRAVDIMVGFLWKSYDLALFPFLNWFIFPAFGYLFARWWRHCKDTTVFFTKIAPFCWVVTSLYVYSIVRFGLCYWSGGDYYGLGPLDAFLCMFAVIAVFGLSRVLLLLCEPVCCVLIRLSMKVTAIYCIHWILIFLLCLPMQYVFKVGYLPNWTIVPVGMLIIFVSDVLASVFRQTRDIHHGGIEDHA